MSLECGVPVVEQAGESLVEHEALAVEIVISTRSLSRWSRVFA